jgi:hypothetical protein
MPVNSESTFAVHFFWQRRIPSGESLREGEHMTYLFSEVVAVLPARVSKIAACLSEGDTRTFVNQKNVRGFEGRTIELILHRIN